MPVKKKKTVVKKATPKKETVEEVKPIASEPSQEPLQPGVDLSSAFAAQNAPVEQKDPPPTQNADTVLPSEQPASSPAPADPAATPLTAQSQQASSPQATDTPSVSAQPAPAPKASGDLAPLDQATQASPANQTASTPQVQSPVVPSESLPVGEIAEESGGSKKVVFTIIGILILILAVLGGVFYYVSTYGAPKKQEQAAKKEVSKPSASPTPTKAESQTLELTKYKIQILNGSGTAGEAGKAGDLLKEAGFKEIVTGNADVYTYKESEVTLSKDAPDALYDTISKALSDTYAVTKAAEFKKTSSTYDAIIVIGSTQATE